MKNKKKDIIIGIVLILLPLVVNFASSSYIYRLPAEEIAYYALPVVVFGFTCLGIAEAMFIRAKIVPKFLEYFFYFQWIVAGMVMLVMLIYILCGGELVITRIE